MPASLLPNRFLRWFFRLPVLVYRLGMPGYERLFGARWIQVTTTGRRTGQPHTVMLDLVGHDLEQRRYYIQSGWGRRCDWVKNIEVHPVLGVQLGRDRFQARATEVTGPEGGEWVLRFMKAHPVQTRLIGELLLGVSLKGLSDEELRTIANEQIVFVLDPLLSSQTP